MFHVWLAVAALAAGATAQNPSSASTSSNSYVIIAPSKIRPNMNFGISVNIIKPNIASTLVTASIMGPNGVMVASGSLRFDKPGANSLSLKTPQAMPSGSYKLEVSGTGGLTFVNSTNLVYNKKEFSLFIQTDKAIYKPGDTVNIRVFGVYADLKGYAGPVDVNIFDEAANKVKQWLSVSPTNGVVTKTFKLSSQPTLGDWKISVYAGRTHTDKIITVAEYVLPKFEVDVILPSYLLISEQTVTATVKAKYTYGKPITGKADVELGILSSYELQYGSSRRKLVSTTRGIPVVNGEAKVSFPMSTVKAIQSYLNGYYLVVEANVTESQSGQVMSSNSTVKIEAKNVKLEFPDTNPNTFKPGLEYTAILKISQPDGQPPVSSNEQVVISTSMDVLVPENKTGTTTTPYPFYYHYPKTVRVTEPDVSMSVPSNGMIAIPISVRADAKDVSINAKFQGASAYLSLKKSYSPSDSYVQLSLKSTSSIKAGDDINLEVMSTQPIQDIVYQVLSRGSIVFASSVSQSSPQNIISFLVRATPAMAPDARIVAYYVTSTGEIVIDSISFKVEGAFKNKVSVSASTKQASPGDTVSVSVDADPSSTAFLMGIDQSVLLLKSGNDVTQSDVIDELKGYDTISHKTSGGFGGPMPMDGCFNCRRKRSIWWDWPMYYGGSDAQKIIENSGVAVLTDCLIYHHVEPYLPIRGHGGGGFLARFEFAHGAPPPVAPAPVESPNEKMQQPGFTRTIFTESWLWEKLTFAGSNGTATVSANIPDTITSWVISAFATNTMSGLGVAPSPAEVTVFKPFFVSLNLPYSVTRGEHLALQAIVFNYLQQDAVVRVTLAKSTDFYNIFVDSNGLEGMKQEEVYQDITVKAGEAKSVFFPIIPAELGHINLEVKAQTSVAADAVRRQLLVEAEGVPKEYNIPFLIDLTDGKTSFSKAVDLTLPATTVKGSELVRVSAVGDLMGPTITGLDTLLRMPTGCGEQTMLGLAPDVYVTDYLKSVNKLTPDIEDKALGYMESGYQRELTYKHKDGSFSAFGDNDGSGSMWLTAFVTRVFHQASSHVFIDTAVTKRAINWMIQRQAANGSFPEPGRVIHKDMQGQAAGGLGLICFVFISLLENKDLFSATDNTYQTAVGLAQTFIESKVKSSNDVYILAMASYALTLASSPEAQLVLDKLEAMAVKDGGLRHWHKAEAAKQNTGSWHSPHGTKAVDTEMTSYVLLTYALKGDIVNGKGIMQWVAQQRNPNGGFTSTQDTVVALNALSQFTKMTTVNNFNIQATAKLDSSPTYTFTIDKTNSLLTQIQETKTVPSRVQVDATGSGMALVEVAVFFNVESEVEDVTFDLTVTLIQESINLLLVETCTRWIGDGESSAMAVQEIGIPSGFAVDQETITKLDILKRIETPNKKVILYFDQIGTTEVCLTFRAERTGLVAKSQPAAVKVYDYYEPGNQVTAFYQSQILKDSSMQDVCPECGL